jgi:RNA recognition motif-containing protein
MFLKCIRFGYIEFGDKASMQKAIETMNGTDIDGRSIRVDNAGK